MRRVIQVVQKGNKENPGAPVDNVVVDHSAGPGGTTIIHFEVEGAQVGSQVNLPPGDRGSVGPQGIQGESLKVDTTTPISNGELEVFLETADTEVPAGSFIIPQGPQGDQGDYEVSVYMNANTQPDAPDAQTDGYNFGSKTFTPPTGWTLNPTAPGSMQIWRSNATVDPSAIDESGLIDLTWGTPFLASAGPTGPQGDQGIYIVFIQRQNGGTLPGAPTGGVGVTTPPTDWHFSQNFRTVDTTAVYQASAAYNPATDTLQALDWSDPYEATGDDGPQGPIGAQGPAGPEAPFKITAYRLGTDETDFGVIANTTYTVATGFEDTNGIPPNWSIFIPQPTDALPTVWITEATVNPAQENSAGTLNLTWSTPTIFEIAGSGGGGTAGEFQYSIVNDGEATYTYWIGTFVQYNNLSSGVKADTSVIFWITDDYVEGSLLDPSGSFSLADLNLTYVGGAPAYNHAAEQLDGKQLEVSVPANADFENTQLDQAGVRNFIDKTYIDTLNVDAGTVNDFTVAKSVPSDAVFTDNLRGFGSNSTDIATWAAGDQTQPVTPDSSGNVTIAGTIKSTHLDVQNDGLANETVRIQSRDVVIIENEDTGANTIEIDTTSHQVDFAGAVSIADKIENGDGNDIFDIWQQETAYNVNDLFWYENIRYRVITAIGSSETSFPMANVEVDVTGGATRAQGELADSAVQQGDAMLGIGRTATNGFVDVQRAGGSAGVRIYSDEDQLSILQFRDATNNHVGANLRYTHATETFEIVQNASDQL